MESNNTSGWKAEVIVVGAGAAGLWAAARAARGGRDVLILEKTPRTGTKVLASGGTRCNLTTTLSAPEAAKLFRAKGERFLRPAFQNLPPQSVRDRFGDWGVPTVVAPLEKIFPSSGRAKDVRDAMEREARDAGVRIQLDAGVTGLRRVGGDWLVEVQGERLARAPHLLLCPGGQSVPKSGTTGDGYGWLDALELPLIDPVPALVPLASEAGWVQALTGIAWGDGELRLIDQRGKAIARRRRPVLFTHTGLSGPAAMDVSVHVAQAPDDAWFARLDLFPADGRDSLRDLLIELGNLPGKPYLGRLLPAPVPKRLLAAICAQAGFDDVPRPSQIGRAARHELVEALKGLEIPIHGTRGWDVAEVTAGGLDLRKVDPRTMRVNGIEGLQVFGELLDLDGPIGGLNFQAAFACAELAGGFLAND
jgi:predicted Rossmann fold flavoprotein